MTMASTPGIYQQTLRELDIDLAEFAGPDLTVRSPIDGAVLASLKAHTPPQVAEAVTRAEAAFADWRLVPTPVRGQLVAALGQELRRCKEPLARLVTLECGKILSEGRGEVQEMIDMCDLAVGLSRQIAGQIFPSELADHTLQETWHPKGVVGIITAFNFPVAVWAWNFALSLLCGNTNVWKPSEKTPLTSLACQKIFLRAAKNVSRETFSVDIEGLSQVVLGRAAVGEALVADRRVRLISATGSCRMGAAVRRVMAGDLGRDCLLELGGNNAVILTPSADLELALPSTLFGAMGTAGQRCTTTRRLLVHDSLYEGVYDFLKETYTAVAAQAVGNPLQPHTLIGPLIDGEAFDGMQNALQACRGEAQDVTGGQRLLEKEMGSDAYYAAPAVVKMPRQTDIVCHETFAPILYVLPYKNLEEAIALNNAVEQGLSAAIFTRDVREAQVFLRDADTGIANVNNGTSGAELGGAFGGNKTTGGGREAGSDAWKAYMNRATNRLNYGAGGLRLAQGVQFPVKIDTSQLKGKSS